MAGHAAPRHWQALWSGLLATFMHVLEAAQTGTPGREPRPGHGAGAPLKIAHVRPYDLALRGGVNASVREMVVRQRRLGHTVDVIGGTSAEGVDVPHWRRVQAPFVTLPANGSMASLAIPRYPAPGGDIAADLETRTRAPVPLAA
jgi:hypothetical protein